MKFERNVKSENGETVYDISIEIGNWEIVIVLMAIAGLVYWCCI